MTSSLSGSATSSLRLVYRVVVPPITRAGALVPVFSLNSASGLVSKIWYRIPFDQSDLSVSRIPLTDLPCDSPTGS